LARAEEGHARLIYSFYKEVKPDAAPFEELYSSLSGELMEGGESVARMMELLEGVSDEPCLDIVEMAVSIEYAAYDLYRNMADYFKDDTMQVAFLSIAQAEKEHMRIAAEALACCRS
jgi:rubrerythrin